ncbi:MAG: CbtB-domain containing protein [Rhodospirillaceae bacterium]|nr:CbtB-domain containing protein [Rhodospirillaceae bacterium]
MTVNSGKIGNNTKANISPSSPASGILGHDISRTNRVITATFALALGLCLLSVVGYAQATHDVAHDARHTFSFPCH